MVLLTTHQSSCTEQQIGKNWFTNNDSLLTDFDLPWIDNKRSVYANIFEFWPCNFLRGEFQPPKLLSKSDYTAPGGLTLGSPRKLYFQIFYIRFFLFCSRVFFSKFSYGVLERTAVWTVLDDVDFLHIFDFCSKLKNVGNLNMSYQLCRRKDKNCFSDNNVKQCQFRAELNSL